MDPRPPGLMFLRSPRRFTAAALLLAVVSGCHSNGPGISIFPPPPPPKASPLKTPDQYPVRDKSSLADASSERLQDIEGALLFYYSLHGRLPAQLSDLNESADPGIPLALTSPTQERPYAYIPNGLRAPGKELRIYVYDPTPLPNGDMRCLLMAEPKRGAATTPQVVPVPAKLFNTYQPVGQ